MKIVLIPTKVEHMSMCCSLWFHYPAVAKMKAVNMQNIRPMYAGRGCIQLSIVVKGRRSLLAAQWLYSR